MSYNDKLRCDNLTTNHEGAIAWRMTPEWELYTTVVTTMGTEDKFYESGDDRIRRITDLVRRVDPLFVAQLAIYAREKMHLRSIPLLLLVELACIHQGDSLVSKAVSRTIQRADEITELLMCHQWRSGKKGLSKMSHQLLKGLAEAFNKFDEYQFAKYDRKDRKVTLRDALVLAHPKAKDARQAEIFRKIMKGMLQTPYTWETELSALGQQHFSSLMEKEEAKRRLWQQLVASRKMGYMATIRNLCNMLTVGIDEETRNAVCKFLSDPEAVHKSKQLPFRFLSAYLSLVNPQVRKRVIPLTKEEKKIAPMEERLRQTNEKLLKKEAAIHHLMQSEATSPELERHIALRQKFEKLTNKLRNGFVKTRVRRVAHFRDVTNFSIYYRAFVRKRQRHVPEIRKKHSSYWQRRLKHRSVPTERMVKDLSYLEAILARLVHQEERLRRVAISSRKRQIKRLQQEVETLSKKREKQEQRLCNSKYAEAARLAKCAREEADKEAIRHKENIRSLCAPLLKALEAAALHTADNIPGFSPDTRVLLASDTSGSMTVPVSKNSQVMCYHIGLLLSMLMKSRCPQAVTGMFGDIWKKYDMPSDNVLSNTLAMMGHEGEVGYSTNGHKVIEWLIRENRVMDKVMLFTDCQLWNNSWCDASLSTRWDEYKKMAPNAKLYIFDLAGYGQSPVNMKRDDVFCIAGWSDKVFDILAALENGSNAIDEIRRIVV